MSDQAFLQKVWSQLTPVMEDLALLYPADNFKLVALRFQGHNYFNPRTPQDPGRIRLFIELEVCARPAANHLLLEKHHDLLNQVWSQLIERFGLGLDIVLVAPIDGVRYGPGLYLEVAQGFDGLPSYQAKR